MVDSRIRPRRFHSLFRTSRPGSHMNTQWARMASFANSLGNVHSLVVRGLKRFTTWLDHQIDVVLRQEDQKLSNVGRKRPKIAKKL